MRFRYNKPKLRPSRQDRHPSARRALGRFGQRSQQKTQFWSSLKKISIPAALFGASIAVAVNSGYIPQDLQSVVDELRSKNVRNTGDLSISQDGAATPTARLNGLPDLVCRNPKVTDGDTLRCGDVRIRLEGIDSPEMGGKCRPGRECVEGNPDAAKANLQRLVSRGPLECSQSDTDHYGRMIARCVVAKVDLSCEQIRTGHAVERYSRIHC